MEKYFQSASSLKGKRKECDNDIEIIEPSIGTSKSRKKTQIKNIKRNEMIGIPSGKKRGGK
jgi:hypothetical protein